MSEFLLTYVRYRTDA